jgi:hypothetical protein
MERIPIDSKGKNYKPEELHKLNNRFRCRECETEFCAECKRSPYHDGMSCAQFEKSCESVKCRYCENTVPSGKVLKY